MAMSMSTPQRSNPLASYASAPASSTIDITNAAQSPLGLMQDVALSESYLSSPQSPLPFSSPPPPAGHASTARPEQSVPLHRRVKIDGLSGRFLRSVVTALAGTNAGSAHILIDVSLTPVATQFDPRSLASMMQSVGCLFGLSSDLLVCHAHTTSADFSHGSLIPEDQRPSLGSHQHSYSTLPGSGGADGLDPTSYALHRVPSATYMIHQQQTASELGPTSQFLKAHPPAVGSLPLIPSMTESEDSGQVADEPDASQPLLKDEDNLHQLQQDPQQQQQQQQSSLSAIDSSQIPAPPPLPAHLHAPRRQGSIERQTLTGAPLRNHEQFPASPLLFSQQNGYHVAASTSIHENFTDWMNETTAAVEPHAIANVPHDSMSPLSPSAESPNYARGPIFSNIFIAHHLHNAPIEVQDVLLQALKLKQIVVDGLPVNLPAIHLCIATHSHTVRSHNAALSQRLRDEFVMDIMADSSFFHSFELFLSQMPPQVSLPIPWESIRQVVNEDESSAGVHVSPQMGQYVRDIGVAFRQHGKVAFGPSPQGLQAFVHAAKCHAFFGGCSFVRPVDVDSVAEDALCHRLTLRATTGNWAKPQAARVLINHMIGKVLLPPK